MKTVGLSTIKKEEGLWKPKEVPLKEGLNKGWLGYATAAGVAGAGLLAGAPSALAGIVFDPGSTAFVSPSICPPGNSPYYPCWGINLEIGSPGADVVVWPQTATFIPSFTLFEAHGAVGGSWAPQGIGLMSNPNPAGAVIGPGKPFVTSAVLSGRTVRCASGHCHTYDFGPWFGQSGYLGFEFTGLDGQIHYGWAFFNVGLQLDGAAYNTVPNQPILAGQTSTPEPPTLGLLALGFLGLAFWRRNAVGASHSAAGSPR